jgi:hypothetical protein
MIFKKGVPAGFIYEGKRELESMEDYLLNELYVDYNKVFNRIIYHEIFRKYLLLLGTRFNKRYK